MSAGRIVVGVDGSAPSRAALRWAVGQARLTGGTVEAVIAWQLPMTLMNPKSCTAIQRKSCSTSRTGRTCSWWAVAATAASPGHCSAR